MHCQCLNRLEFPHFSSPTAAMFVENEFTPKSSLVTWLITLGLIICPSSYKDRLDNLIGNVCPQIISPQWSNARPNFPIKKCVGGAKFGLVSRLMKLANM